jgi:phage gp46-like protein
VHTSNVNAVSVHLSVRKSYGHTILTDSTLKLAREYAEDALQWLVDDHVAESVSVSAERGGVEQLNLNVVIKRPDQATLNLQFQNVWGS